MPCLTAPQQRVGEGEGKKKGSFVTQTLPKALGNEIIKEGSSACPCKLPNCLLFPS